MSALALIAASVLIGVLAAEVESGIWTLIRNWMEAACD